MNKIIQKIGHRGACGYEPENTLKSFRKALELGTDIIELDIRLCKTSEIVVIHDETVDRTTNGQGYVAALSLTELHSLDAGKGQRIPTLKEVLRLINKKIQINIEIKDPLTVEPLAQMLTEYISKRHWRYDHFLVSSFDHTCLKKLHELNPEINIGILITKIPPGLKTLARQLNAYSINISKDYITPAFTKQMQARGHKIFVWTVDNYKTINKMKKMGVDGIASNFPDRLN